MLKFDAKWRFHSPGPIADGVQADFVDLIGKVIAQVERQKGLEHFKRFFANAAGFTSSWSSSASWAETDLHNYMAAASTNAPLFIEGFYDACVAYGEKGIAVPDAAMINAALSKHKAGYEIVKGELVARHATSVVNVAHVQSLDEQALDIVQKSLQQSEEYLATGRPRQAVQEILWLLETISTLFQGLQIGNETIQGKYFNKIADELRRHQKGTSFEQALNWATTLHGYLSSPTGGGVRHGANLKAGLPMQENEARLFCNLIRSYITFLLSEHERLSKPSPSAGQRS